jgi:hypothetical protein
MPFARTAGMRRVSTLGLLGSLALMLACGGGNNTTKPNPITTPAQNVQAITVDAGATGSYVNGAFATITVCASGSTSNCQQIDHMLVDTGSVGLRILSSSSGGELTLSLPQTSIGGSPVGECTQFVDLSFFWGPVETADVRIAGEVASSIPINVIGDTTFSAASGVPSSCGVAGSPDDADSLAALGANGILGVGSFLDDCGNACVSGATPPSPNYYQCPSSGCVPSFVSAAQLVQNPVSLFASDNNGVIVELPASSGPQATLSGSLVFGIGTQSNNALGGATVLTFDQNSNFDFTTNFSGSTLASSFIDSGSNGLFFDDNSLTICPTPNAAFYCPATPPSLTALNSGSNGASTIVTFNVINTDTAFNSFPNATVFPGLAGPNHGSFSSFDWGLPFFYGRNVFTSIQGTTAPGGQTPYWAY